VKGNSNSKASSKKQINESSRANEELSKSDDDDQPYKTLNENYNQDEKKKQAAKPLYLKRYE
jgi:chaperonin cofactor prefoldin